ncbi:MAG: carboxylating nicotinate-nucleotide diphosphorylase [bacterium]
MNDRTDKYKKLITEALEEDIGNGDHSTMSVIPPNTNGRMVLKIKEDGVLAGMEVAESVLKTLDPDINFIAYKKDGDKMVAGEIAFEIEGLVHAMLKGERLLLNCMQRMSGIATLTSTYVNKVKGYKTRILDTRKTTPNFRLLEKEAVRIGGAVNHRFGLYDMIMLKDNHIDFAGGIEKAILLADDYRKRRDLNIQIEVEARSLDDVVEICKVGREKVFRIMLDNFTPDLIVHAMQLIGGEFETEASGGINFSNIESYAATGVDYVSIGALIHHAVSLDLSLKAMK